MVIKSESEDGVFPRSTEALDNLSDEAQAKLQAFSEKYSDLISNASLLPQPLRAIAEFVKKEGGRE